jgi:hypothetical protein
LAAPLWISSADGMPTRDSSQHVAAAKVAGSSCPGDVGLECIVEEFDGKQILTHLERFQAESPRSEPTNEHRFSVRHAPARGLDCWVSVLDGSTLYSASIENISRSGIGLRLCQRFEPGTLLSVEVIGWKASQGILAIVVRDAAAESDSWLLGCEYFACTPSTAQLEAFTERCSQVT